MSSGFVEILFPTYACPLFPTLHPVTRSPAPPRYFSWHCSWRDATAFGSYSEASLLTIMWPVCICWLRCSHVGAKDTSCLAFPCLGYAFTPLACVWPWIFWKKNLCKRHYISASYLSWKSIWIKLEISMLARERWAGGWIDKAPKAYFLRGQS